MQPREQYPLAGLLQFIRYKRVATPMGIEPTTSRVTVQCSSRLNYGAVYSREYSIPHFTERGATPGGLERSDLSLNLRRFESAWRLRTFLLGGLSINHLALTKLTSLQFKGYYLTINPERVLTSNMPLSIRQPLTWATGLGTGLLY